MTDLDRAHLVQLIKPATRAALAATGLDWSVQDANLCAALVYCRDARDPFALVGLVGGASSGKSTVFNSLLAREVSRISAHAHETVGPIVAAHENSASRLRQHVSDDQLFASWEVRDTDASQPTEGTIDAITLVTHDQNAIAHAILCDLPDVTSKLSADEGAIARNLLPFLDALVVIVDEERWFDKVVLEEFVARARDFGSRVWIVFNRTENGPPLSAEQRERIERLAETHHAEGFVVSEFRAGSGYRPISDAARTTCRSWVESAQGGQRRRALADQLRLRAARVIAENVARGERYENMLREVDKQLNRTSQDASLTIDLLTADERGLLGLGHRYVPLYDWVRQIGRSFRTLTGQRIAEEIDFEKRPAELAEVLKRNLALRFERATSRIDECLTRSDYLSRDVAWENNWSVPAIDADDWARRIQAHINRWKEEAKKQSKRGDLAALSVGTPLLLADLIFLGGAGITMTWAAAWIAGFLGGKGLARLTQQSPAYNEYQTTVKAYQALVREALTEQWQANLANMPRRHLKTSDPIMSALLYWSTPGRS